jgi:hypothetical protein
MQHGRLQCRVIGSEHECECGEGRLWDRPVFEVSAIAPLHHCFGVWGEGSLSLDRFLVLASDNESSEQMVWGGQCSAGGVARGRVGTWFLQPRLGAMFTDFSLVASRLAPRTSVFALPLSLSASLTSQPDSLTRRGPQLLASRLPFGFGFGRSLGRSSESGSK